MEKFWISSWKVMVEVGKIVWVGTKETNDAPKRSSILKGKRGILVKVGTMKADFY
jgi:hypothetical protein